MGKTADLAMVQKAIIDTIHKESKSQRVITERGGSGADWGQKVVLDFLVQSGPPNPVRNTPHHKWVAYSWHNNLSFLVYMANSK